MAVPVTEFEHLDAAGTRLDRMAQGIAPGGDQGSNGLPWVSRSQHSTRAHSLVQHVNDVLE
jgi:hypothetical protein